MNWLNLKTNRLFRGFHYRIIYIVIKINTKLILITLFLIGIIIAPHFLRAETSDIVIQASDIDIETIPLNPEPYQDVTINLTSYATDLNKAMIKWQSGTKTIMSGYGKTSYTFKTFGPNTTSVFNVLITPENSFTNITKSVLISPSEVGLLWESVDGYAPPFYKGKTFVSREGWIKVVALPNTNTIKQGRGNITYTWSSNDKTIQNASGYGRDSYVFQNSLLNKSENITVVASSVEGKYNATKSIFIPTVSPKIIFYEKSPINGILYGKALKAKQNMPEDEMTIVAEPYFLAINSDPNNFTYQWKINGKKIETPSKKTELTVRPSSRGGYATIGLTIQNLKTLFQEVTGSLKLNL